MRPLKNEQAAKMTNTYPIIKIPYDFKRVNNITPPSPRPPMKPNEPKEPLKPNRVNFPGGCFFMLIVTLITTTALISQTYNWFSILISCVGIVIWIVYIKTILEYFNEKKSYPSKLKQYHVDFEKYKRFKKSYEDELLEYYRLYKKYEVLKEEILSDTYIDNYRISSLRAKLKTTFPPIGGRSNELIIKKGVSENFFLNYLQTFEKEFVEYIFDEYRKNIEPSLILADTSIILEGIELFPDIVYWSKNTNIIIDIEIDEPYVGYTGEPIHYKDSCISDSDHRRDSLILSNNWIIVRFAEEQIFKDPLACAQYIGAILGDIYNGYFNFDHLKESVPSVKCWTKEDSIRMALNKYRHSYIPTKYHNLLGDSRAGYNT